LTLVVADETIVGREIERCCDVNRIKGTKAGLGQRSGREKEFAIDGAQPDAICNLVCSSNQAINWQPGVELRGATYGSWKFGEHKLAGDEVRPLEKPPQRGGLRFIAHQFHEGRGIGVEERQSGLSADLLESPTESMRVPAPAQWLRQPPATGPSDPPFCDQPIQICTSRRRRSQLGDRPIVVGDEQTFALCDAQQIAAQVLTELGNSHCG